MSYAFTLGGPFVLGIFCTAVAWRIQSKRTRILFGLLLALPMVAIWQGAMQQVGGQPTVLSVAWAMVWSSPFWLTGIAACAWIIPSNRGGADWYDRNREDRES